MKEIELINKRKKREKHFLQPNGSIIAKMYDEDVHYIKNGKYKDIDNTLVRKGKYFVNKSNSYKAKFPKKINDSLFKIESEENYLEMKLKSPLALNCMPKIKAKLGELIYNDILDNIDFEYKTLANKVKETIVLKKGAIDKLEFVLTTNLDLFIENKNIVAKKEDDVVFTIESSFMVDSNGLTNENINYSLSKYKTNYMITLHLDYAWLKSSERKYPIYIDPTISNNSQNGNIYDTYIYPGDTDENRNSQPILKAGVERVNGKDIINRALIKFDLPEISTGSQIIGAYLNLTSYHTMLTPNENKLVTMHRITCDWNEETANWNTMNDKFDKCIESIFYGPRSYVQNNVVIPQHGLYACDITNLVKKWYTNLNNYGLLLKSASETYVDDNYPAFYSKSNTMSGGNPMPIFQIVYRNQNGLENYLNYKNIQFTNGNCFVNTFNGNATTIFALNNTVGGSFPASVSLVYNSNDVVLNNTSIFGKGYKLNLNQTVESVIINETEYLSYNDEDGTVHYFYKDNDNPNFYYDEDSLDLVIEKQAEKCIMSDKTGSKMIFTKISNKYYLTEVSDVNQNKLLIELNDNKEVLKITDSNEQEINFVYGINRIDIVSSNKTTRLNYQNNLLSSMESLDGITSFSYNDNHLISSIIDVTGIKIAFEYYEKAPFKMKKVTQYGLDNEIGDYFTLEYGFNTTNIVDKKGKVSNLIFNSYGNLISTNSLDSKENINNAYTLSAMYGDETSNKNRILSDTIPIKHVKNYLSNTSFEETNINFVAETSLLMDISSEFSRTGNNSLKISSTQFNKCIEYQINVPKGKFYTFSGYFKNESNLSIELNYTNADGNMVNSTENLSSTDDFLREDVTIYYDENANSDLKIKINLLTPGVNYLDDIQLEEGEIANNYNIVENSDFSNGLSNWNLFAVDIESGAEVNTEGIFSKVNFNDNNSTALKINMNPLYRTVLSKTYNIKGKKEDTYNVSFWYKNKGLNGDGNVVSNSVSIYFKPVGSDASYCILPSQEFNPNNDIWQYFTFQYTAEEDYESISIIFNQGRQANEFYLTNISLYKDISNNNYSYDNNGNLLSIKNKNKNQNNIFKYDKNNQLINLTKTKGENFKFEYDNIKTDSVINAISSSGINNQIKYDLNNNPILTRISKKTPGQIETGIYRIRVKGTEKYLNLENGKIILRDNQCSYTEWFFEKLGDYYKISSSTINDYYLSEMSNNLLFSNKFSMFALEENKNGSYNIKSNLSGKYLRSSNNELEFSNLVLGDYCFEFYIELINNKFIENTATYTDDGRFIQSITDTNFNKTSYVTDTTTGLLTSVTNSKNQITNYEYNSKQQISSITQNNRTVSYEYNDKNLLSEISIDDRKYSFMYDNFLNLKNVKIGNNNILVNNTYGDGNGNLLKTTYGNNNEIVFEYDEFNRMKKAIKMDDIYNYKYDNNGSVAKIISNNYTEKFGYDINKRLIDYRYNDLKINYEYNNGDNIIKEKHKLNNHIHNVNYVLNEDNLPISTKIDSDEINYSYDELDRLSSSNINGKFNTQYNYASYGKRASALLESIKINNDEYLYKYDELSNITEIYLNGSLKNKYAYDELNQLIFEEDYINAQKTTYIYDNFGNILTKTMTNLLTNGIISIDTYQYSNNNWKDQLSNYNGESIIYDGLGNPIKIGNNITMNWINGRSLNGYIDAENGVQVNYEYNANGIRTSKTVNGVKTKYFLSNENIIYEQRGTDLIYYLYDSTGLIGFRFNGSTYYYLKNIQKDIVGILDSDFNKIVSYEYNAWGKILSIKDGFGNPIIDPSNIGLINPFRYRSYYYDSEIKAYYLNSRYYNPEWCRFINADGLIGNDKNVLSYNIYLYTENNPVNCYDSNGEAAISIGLPAVGLLAAGILLAKVLKEPFVRGLTSLFGMISQSISNVKTRSSTKAKKKKRDDTIGHNVYVLRNNAGITMYVGRTTDLDATKIRHKNNQYRANLYFDPVIKNVSKEQARGLEQELIIECGTLIPDKINPVHNQINGVSLSNINYQFYWDLAITYLDENVVLCNDPSRIK